MGYGGKSKLVELMFVRSYNCNFIQGSLETSHCAAGFDFIRDRDLQLDSTREVGMKM